MSDFSLTISTPDGEPAARTVGVRGAMTIHNAGEVREALLAALAEADEVRMDMEQVTQIDLAGLQLLCSAHRTAVAGHKCFNLGGNCDAAVKEAVDDAGFPRHAGCARDTGKTCIWIEGGNTWAR